MTADTALSGIVEGQLSKHQYMIVRDLARASNSNVFPSYFPTVIEAKKRCYPENITINETSAEVELQSLLNHTANRILKVSNDIIEILNPEMLRDVRLILKWGFDGSSGHSEYKQRFADKNSSDATILLTSLVPLRMIAVSKNSNEEEIVWANPRPSSPRFCRPIRIQFLRENVETSLAEERHIKNQIKSLKPYETVVDMQKIVITFELNFTMLDGKVVNAVTDTKSAMRCHLCKLTSKNFNNLNLVREKEVDVSKLDLGLSTLHAWIRCFECMLHIGYKLKLGKWQARGDEKQVIAERKKTIQAAFRQELGLIVDQQKPGFGSSNDGNTARRFFTDAKTSARILGVDENLICRLHVVLQVMSCGLAIDVDSFRDYCYETAEIFVSKYEWFCMPTTLHKVLMHGAEIIEAAVLPIGLLSEDAQESRNKDIKKLRERYSRKTSRTETMEDVFHGLLVSSDPVISSMRKLPSQGKKELPFEAQQLLAPSERSKDVL